MLSQENNPFGGMGDMTKSLRLKEKVRTRKHLRVWRGHYLDTKVIQIEYGRLKQRELQKPK